jgi:hypothetical protein
MTRRSIKFDCHYCLNPVTAWQDECGREFCCPHCQTVLIVPSQPIDASLFDDIFESLNPVQLADRSSAAATPETNIPKPILENVVEKMVIAKAASQAASPNNRGSEATPETGASDSTNLQAAPQIPLGKVNAENARATVSRAIAEPKPSEPNQPQQDVMERLLDEAAEFKSALRSEDRGDDATGDHDLPLHEGETPPEPDITDVPLKIDGWDFEQAAEVISLKCKICDSRIHTDASKIDTEIVCPVCYTKILVTSAMLDKLAPSKRENSRDTKMSFNKSVKDAQSQEDDGDLPLIPLEVEANTADSRSATISKIGLGGGTGKAAVGQTSLNPGGSETAPMPVVNTQDGMPEQSGKRMSRREKYEAAQRRLAGLDRPMRGAIKPPQHSTNQRIEGDAEHGNRTRSNHGTVRVTESPAVDYSAARFWVLLTSPGLIWRAAVAALVSGIGSGTMHRISRQYAGITEPTIPDWFLNTLVWAGMGLVPYFIGVGLLWLLCGFVFRDTAAGREQVSSWSIHSFGELKSTFLIFGFSFFVAGLPISPIPMMFPFVHPLRCLVAPLFLLSAWYRQNALAIVAVDAFKHFQREKNEWGQFYSVAMGFGLIGFVGGMLMWVSFSFPFVTFITSLLGAMMVTLSTVLFASAAGWHCGWVVTGTSGTNSAKPIDGPES